MITMRSLTVVRKGADVVVIYVMEIDVNIVWPMDFVRWIILSIFEDTDLQRRFRFPFDTNHVEFKLSAFTFHDYKEKNLKQQWHKHQLFYYFFF